MARKRDCPPKAFFPLPECSCNSQTHGAVSALNPSPLDTTACLIRY